MRLFHCSEKGCAFLNKRNFDSNSNVLCCFTVEHFKLSQQTSGDFNLRHINKRKMNRKK